MSGGGRWTVAEVTQYGVRYCDGEVEGPFSNAQSARGHMRSIRQDIKDGAIDADDYEPMEFVERTHRVQVTPWLGPVNER